MAPIVVCPSDHAQTVAGARQPSRILGLASPDDEPPVIGAVPSLLLRFNDITSPRAELVAPSPEAIAAILAFGTDWDETGPLLIHCRMGISRSTAAALCVACAKRPDLSENALAIRLRDAAPCATPNTLMISIADGLLGRDGRLIAAANAIGRGADFAPYRSFDLSLG